MAKMKFYSLWLCLVCIIVFILQYLFPSITGFGILNKSAIYNYEVWRFVTPIFLHGGITHLFYNLFALFFFGIALEKLIGSRKFLFSFFASGIIANIIAVNFYESSLGASGAIMGIIGILTIVKPMLMVWAFGLILPMFIAGILWVVGSILGSLGMFPGDTGYIAHLAGIGIGLIIGLFLRFFTRKTEKSNNKTEIPAYYPEKNTFSQSPELRVQDIENWEERHLK